MKDPVLSTKRFHLREFCLEDAPHLYKLNLHPDVFRFTTDPPFESIDAAIQFVKNYNAYKQFGFGRWSILEKETNQFIGWSGLKYILSENEVDIGYRILPEYWGKGIAVETGKACCEFGIREFGLRRIVARIHKENIRSIRVAQKMNMIYEKDLLYDGIPWLNYLYLNTLSDLNASHFINFKCTSM